MRRDAEPNGAANGYGYLTDDIVGFLCTLDTASCDCADITAFERYKPLLLFLDQFILVTAPPEGV